MDENLINEEKEYLHHTVKRIDTVIGETERRIDSLYSLYNKEPRLLANLLSQFHTKLKLIEKIQNKPYFARIDFKNETGKVEKCYIGKVGINDNDDNLITVDWRAPISSMYYDSNIGDASYQAPEGIIKGELLLKRQFEINDKKLESFHDVDTVSNDEILKPYLSASADNRLKNIIATIQSEQNEIIRSDLYNNLIVQGVAGSGKTTVALHRVAYLVYNYIDKINVEQYLVIGPSKFFVNYISGVLPDLDVNNVSQLTYLEIVEDLLKEKLNLASDESKLKSYLGNGQNLNFEKIRNSMQYKIAIDNFLNDYTNTIIKENLIIKGYNMLNKNIIKKNYEMVKNTDIISEKINRAILFISKYINENKERILNKLTDEYYFKIESADNNSIKKLKEDYDFVLRDIKGNCQSSLKKYFDKLLPKTLNIYYMFLQNINNYMDLDENELTSASKVANNIKKKIVEFEDLGALLYIHYRIYGSGKYEKYRHTVVDESQDFGDFSFYALKKLLKESTFSIFGDLAQSIYEYRAIDTWESVIKNTFDNDCEIKYLKKSYRTTVEIMEEANKILKHLNMQSSEPVIRHGKEVKYYNIEEEKDCLLSVLNNYIKSSYQSIAIITKDESEAKIINDYLNSQNIEVKNITDKDNEYNGGICVIPCYLAKGLEFDGVIISNVDAYNKTNTTDMKLLYVAMTRPLHELNILYNHDLMEALK